MSYLHPLAHEHSPKQYWDGLNAARDSLAALDKLLADAPPEKRAELKQITEEAGAACIRAYMLIAQQAEQGKLNAGEAAVATSVIDNYLQGINKACAALFHDVPKDGPKASCTDWMTDYEGLQDIMARIDRNRRTRF